MAVSGVSESTVKVVDADKTGFNALTSEDFLKLLITQLQNQDPTSPVGNEELLGQLSQMRSLQSNIELGDTLKTVSSNQNLSTAASFIGKTVRGQDIDGNTVVGVVDRAFIAEGATYVRVGETAIELANVTDVTTG